MASAVKVKTVEAVPSGEPIGDQARIVTVGAPQATSSSRGIPPTTAGCQAVTSSVVFSFARTCGR